MEENPGTKKHLRLGYGIISHHFMKVTKKKSGFGFSISDTPSMGIQSSRDIDPFDHIRVPPQKKRLKTKMFRNFVSSEITRPPPPANPSRGGKMSFKVIHLTPQNKETLYQGKYEGLL